MFALHACRFRTACQACFGVITRDIGVEARHWGLFSEAVAVCRSLGTHLRKVHSSGTKVFAISMEARNPFHPIESSREVESGSPSIKFSIINSIEGHSDSANYQDETCVLCKSWSRALFSTTPRRWDHILPPEVILLPSFLLSWHRGGGRKKKWRRPGQKKGPNWAHQFKILSVKHLPDGRPWWWGEVAGCS